jgi:pyruvate/2-oxoglutarate dehydrogenase complex dihydrolipoamide dehydrogenase (E3) component
MANETLTPDLCVIGGDAAGASLAAAAAVLGARVVLIAPEMTDDARPTGAALPVHALAAAARRVNDIRESARFGIAAAPDTVFARVRDSASALLQDLALNASDARIASLGVRVLHAAARFVDPKTVTAGNREVRARRYVLALGSVPRVPPIRGLERTPYLSPAEILDLRELPAHLIVIGAGATGLAIAQAFRRLGSEVTVLDAATPLRHEDPECAALVLEALARDGVTVRRDVEIERVSGRNSSIRVTFTVGQSEETIDGTRLLIATGNRSLVEGHGLELAGIEFDAGGIRAGNNLRSSNRQVFVVGASGMPHHAARWHAQLILGHSLFRAPIRANAAVIPRVSATDPEIAHVGLREDSAQTLHRRIRVLRAPFFENERAEIEREGKGMIKLVTTRSGRLLGATIVGTGAGDLIGTYALALSKRMHVRELAGPVFPPLTRAEIGRQAALGGLSRGLTNTWVQRIMTVVRLFP